MVYNAGVLMVKSLDYIDDFFDLIDQLDHRFLGHRHLDGDSVDTWDPAFRGSKCIDIDTPTGKNDRNSIENSNKIFGDNEDSVAFHREQLIESNLFYRAAGGNHGEYIVFFLYHNL